MRLQSTNKGEANMELVLDANEVKSAVIAWGKEQFPRVNFDDVHFDIGYGTLRSATLKHKEPEAKEEA